MIFTQAVAEQIGMKCASRVDSWAAARHPNIGRGREVVEGPVPGGEDEEDKGRTEGAVVACARMAHTQDGEK